MGGGFCIVRNSNFTTEFSKRVLNPERGGSNPKVIKPETPKDKRSRELPSQLSE